MTIDEIKKQLCELLDDRRSFLTGDKDYDEIYLKDIKALELVLDGLDYHKSLKKSFENLVQQLANEQQATVTEYCPHCDTEVTVKWLPSVDGHSIYCPKCGKRIMLCSECPVTDDEFTCDWAENKTPCCAWDTERKK